jgi:hypothetical protein
MPLITNAALQAILDKLARFATESVGDPEFSESFNAGMDAAAANVFLGAGALDQYILDTDDIDVVADLLPAARDLGEDPPSPSDGFILSITSISAMINALNAHCKRYGPAGTTGLDNYLTGLNLATPTLRAHGHFRKYLKTISAKNSFVPNDTVLATLTVTGAAAGTFASVASIATTSYAGAKLVVKNQGAVTTGATLTVTGKKFDGTSAALTATINTGTDNTETDLSDTTKLFVQVTNITISGGTATDVYEIVAKTDRSIAAA